MRSPDEVVTPRWYTTEQVAIMLSYGLTKTKYLVSFRPDPIRQGRGKPAHLARMGR